MAVVHRELIRREPNVANVILIDALKPTQKARSELYQSLKPRTTSPTFKQVLMVVGIPNTGKSTLINTLISEGSKAPVSASPGWTRGQTIYQLKRKNAYLMDTAGVLAPGVLDPEQGLKLAACGLIKESVVPGGVQTIVDYLLYFFNQRENTQRAYRSFYEIPDTEGEIDDALLLVPFIAKRYGKFDEDSACRQFLKSFQLGQLGKYTLDFVERPNTTSAAADSELRDAER